MIKFVMCLTRKEGLSREAFKTYWQKEHGDFFVKNAAAIFGARKYVQSRTIDTPLNEGLRESRGLQAEYDGVAEVWFDSEEAMVTAMSTPEGQKLATALQEDEHNFIDHTKSSAFIVEELALI